MGNMAYARQLWQKITEYNLDAQYPDLANIKTLIEQGLLDDDLAQGILLQIEPLIQQAIDHPNYLHRLPDEAQIHPNSPPDIELGSLVNDPSIRFGLRFRDRPRSVLIAGNAGSGKTTAIRNIVLRTDELSHNDPSQHVSLVIIEKKLDYVDLKSRLRQPCLHLSVHDSKDEAVLGSVRWCST